MPASVSSGNRSGNRSGGRSGAAPRAWARRVADALPFARRLPGFGALTGGFQAPPPPQPFSLACPCGGTVSGTRGDSEREEPCPDCGEPHFVLPADVYPAPRTAAPAKAPANAKRAERAAAAPADAAKKPSEPPANDAKPAPAAPTVPSVPLGARLRAAARKRVTPLRAIAAGLALVVGGTVWWSVIQSRRADAELALAELPPVAAEALAEGRFAEAAERFETLAAAYATLDRADDPPARAARQQAREATAAAGLASQTPAEIARQAALARTPADRTEWSALYDGLCRGRWVILDVYAARVSPPDLRGPLSRAGAGKNRGAESDEEEPGDDDSPEPRIELLYPMLVPGARARVIGDPGLPDDLAVGDDPRRVLLAARYGDCVRVPEPGGKATWELRLEPGSAFLWTGADTLGAIGFDLTGPEGEELRALLARQADAVGLAPNGPAPDDAAEPPGEPR